ncbi:MAG: UpxY family transcription antiterminator [Bacteroidales bacterium]|jgi:transcription antitermination factor NusG|nr:UpxY family transcription antiterminator [Bacteroidales bacterium]MBR3730828.1 UpxY family transcription antiterminator [Bacteroidales bacterium]MBR6929669.1 UpxY family transcription antiterminator [Bacteroidales bacterium]
MESHDQKYWHALYVRSRAEKKVLWQLEENGFTAYLPLITQMKQWSDRKKKVEEPLFKSYVFVYSNEREYIPILNVYGVIKFVTFERKAVIVPENQILAIKKFVNDFEKGEEYKMMNNEELKVGQKVRIINGPMKGLTGRLETIRNKRHLIVYIDVVGQCIPVHIPRAKVEPCAD